MNKKEYKDYIRILPSLFLVLVLIGIIFGSSIASARLSESQAVEYLDQSSHRAAEELGKAFRRQDESILTMAHMTAHIMDYERIDTARLIHLTEESAFDGIEYIHPSGKCYGMNEQGWDVSDKAYFLDAAEQNVGYAYDDAPERGLDGCLVFYAPIVSDQGVFYGILVGYLRCETLADMLDISFWGHGATQYLCTTDGTVIASNAAGNCGVGIAEVLQSNSDLSERERRHLTALWSEKNGTFRYRHDGKKELGSVCSVSDSDFLLLETFPPEVLSELSAPILNKMHIAVVAVILAISVYGIFMFFLTNRSKRNLEAENEKVNALLKGAEGRANHDALTGLYNRRGLLDAVTRLRPENRSLAFLLLDLDHFKQTNDQYGHKAGDDLLVRVAGLLRETFREQDILARMGGDEFAVILPGMRPENANIIKEKISRINERLKNPTDDVPPSALSVGVAFSQMKEDDDLFVRADKALYRTKEKGRCGCCVYEEEF